MDKRQKILIVDDAEFNRVILKEILGETYNYLEAENGNQAIQIVEENPEIDLMLLDINMPQHCKIYFKTFASGNDTSQLTATN